MSLPDPYTPEVVAEICKRLAGGESLRAICRSDGMPARTTVIKWVLDDRDGFADQYARAKAVGIDEFADETIEIADTPAPGVIETDKIGVAGPYTEVQRRDAIEHRRLQVDTRKWYVSKLAPKLYGDKLALEHSGEIGTRSYDDEERMAKIDAIFAAIERRLNENAVVDGIG